MRFKCTTRFLNNPPVHTTTRATPAQLVFGRDAMLNVQHKADWKCIESQKRKRIADNNARENAKLVKYDYAIGDRVLVKAEQASKYGSNSYLGPYTIVRVNDNGTVRVDEGTVTDTYNIRNITPYQQ